MKIFLAQQNYHIGNIDANTQKIIAAVEHAKNSGGDLIVFSELSVCGYPPRDFLYFKDFINKNNTAINAIKQYADGIGVLIGAPVINPSVQGKDLYNAAWFLADKEIKQVFYKTCLPTYDVFDEDRYFEPASKWELLEFKGKKIAVTICEDIWNLGNNPLYTICPMDKLAPLQPDVMINLSASPFDYTHDKDREAIVKANVLRYKIPVFYCNTVGSQTEIVFDGASFVMDNKANLCGRLKRFEEDLQAFVLHDNGSIGTNILATQEQLRSQELTPMQLNEKLNIPLIYEALVLGIKDYFSKMGFTKAILGSSGGIDSAVVLALACEALGKDNVTAMLMPSQFSTTHSVSDAEQLSKNLNNPYHIIPIKNIYESFLNELDALFAGMPFGIAEENIQSRARGNLLMAIANKFGYILLNTSNKSELATGYGTLYGDMAGGLAVLGDCYKLQIYELAKFINHTKEIIPLHKLTKPPSAELWPAQKDSDSLPDYALLDKILYQYIELSKGPDEIKTMGFEEAMVDRVLKLVNVNEYKRNQFCPIIRISPKSFGIGRRVPIVAKYLA